MIDPKKTYKTRDGREVRIYSIDAGGERPVHGATKEHPDKWECKSWYASGHYLTSKTGVDLIEVRPRIKREVWMNVYSTYTHIAATKGDADHMAHHGRIACVKLTIDCEEGEGL